MKTKNYFLAIGLVVSSVVSTYLVTLSAGAQTPARAAVADNDYQVGGVLYMQQAGEYRALAYQAFNLARWQLDADFEKKNLKKLAKAERKQARAVVVDVDETILDNSPQQADLIKRRLSFSPALFTVWVNKRTAKPIPGAVDFLTYANQKGVKVFYVTNRSTEEKPATIDNLKSVGFPDATDETVMPRADTSSKEPRREMILQKYRIVFLMGDNLNDFSNVFERKSVAERFMEVDKTHQLFGKKFIVLPNLIYGDWENAIYDYKRLTETEKTARRFAAMEGF